MKLEDCVIEEKSEKIKINGEKQKLFPTEIGNIVNVFLDKHFSNIMNLNFTANIESNLDQIASGSKDWVNVVRDFYKVFNTDVIKITGISKNPSNLEKNKYTRVIGTDPYTGYDVCTYIAKYGPVVQLKNTDDLSKSKFAPLKDIKMEEVTIKQALELLKYPYVIGQISKKDVSICKGQYGIYVKYNNKNYSINDIEENDLTLNIIKSIITNKDKGSNSGNNSGSNSEYKSNILREINKDIIIKTGKYGPYICYKGKTNVKIYSKKKMEDLTLEDCQAMIKKKKEYLSKK